MLSTSQKGAGKRLNKTQRLEIISKLRCIDAPLRRSIAQDYQVLEGAIRKVWNSQAHIQEDILDVKWYSANIFLEKGWSILRCRRSAPSMDRFNGRAKLSLPPSLIIAKAKPIATSLG
jgi:hypothetical protein